MDLVAAGPREAVARRTVPEGLGRRDWTLSVEMRVMRHVAEFLGGAAMDRPALGSMGPGRAPDRRRSITRVALAACAVLVFDAAASAQTRPGRRAAPGAQSIETSLAYLVCAYTIHEHRNSSYSGTADEYTKIVDEIIVDFPRCRWLRIGEGNRYLANRFPPGADVLSQFHEGRCGEPGRMMLSDNEQRPSDSEVMTHRSWINLGGNSTAASFGMNSTYSKTLRRMSIDKSESGAGSCAVFYKW